MLKFRAFHHKFEIYTCLGFITSIRINDFSKIL